MNKNKRIWLALVFMLIFKSFAFAESNLPVCLTIAGEAGGEGYKGMYAVACVINNRAKIQRKTFNQVVATQFYGKDTKYARIALQTQKKTILAIVDKLEKGLIEDITGGATHFENVERFGMPQYIKKNPKRWVVTCKIKHHTFFKEKR